jgi:cob(I)alamin adenosyltransferase
MIAELDAEVARIEAMEGILSDWSLPGAMPVTAALDVARTVCRRAERAAVRIAEGDPGFSANILTYLNRLSDLIWLFGRALEMRAGVNGALRPEGKRGKPWSKPW